MLKMLERIDQAAAHPSVGIDREDALRELRILLAL